MICLAAQCCSVTARLTVWVIDPTTSTLAPRAVQVLARSGSTVRVSGALHNGEKVVTAGVNGMQSGQKIRVQREVGL